MFLQNWSINYYYPLIQQELKKIQLLGWLPNIRNICLVFKFPATLYQILYSLKITLNLKLKILKINTFDNISLKVLLKLFFLSHVN